MNKKIIFILAGVVLTAMTSLTMTSCDDDHFTVDPTIAGKGNVWENISQTPELSEFASILKRVYFSTSENTVTTQTYADLISHDQTFTVWAPKNGTFNYEIWNRMLESGDRKQIYEVETQLIRNCMTRYSHVLNGNKQENITFFNSKKGVFDCAARTINGVNITDANLGCNNGVLHITDGPVVYMPNLYEYINSQSNLTQLSTFLKQYEKEEFNEAASTQGPTIDGNITWVDSITYLTNTYFNGRYLNAYINREDSNYVMILPTDECWNAEYEKMNSYYNYVPTYIQSVTTVSVSGSTITESTERLTTTFTDEELDSIKHFRTCDAIARNLCFNHNYQFGHDYKDMATEGACDSIQSTSGLIFYDPASAALFNKVEPVQLSNGYAYVVDDFKYDLKDTWLDEVKYEAERNYESYEYCTIDRNRIYIDNPWRYVEMESEDAVPFTPTDTVIETTAITLNPQRATSNTSVLIKAPNTLSCKYDIVAVMVYNIDKMLPYQFRAYVNYHNAKQTQDRVQLMPIEGVNGTDKLFRTKKPHVDEKGMLQFNDSVLLAQDFEFPVCYYGLSDAYVTVQLQSNISSRDRSFYTNEIIVDKIIFIPKENETSDSDL